MIPSAITMVAPQSSTPMAELSSRLVTTLRISSPATLTWRSCAPSERNSLSSKTQTDPEFYCHFVIVKNIKN